jgi:hypothetical protein
MPLSKAKSPAPASRATAGLARTLEKELIPQNASLRDSLAKMSDDELVLLRAGMDVEMRKRGIAFSVGGVGERLVIEYFRKTAGLPKLQAAPRGTKNVDALSRNGDRYSIKTICSAKKTGTVYPDSQERDRQLFEYILIVRLSEKWTLESIYQLSWSEFIKVRSWDKRMNAWYVAISSRTLDTATLVFKTSNSADA